MNRKFGIMRDVMNLKSQGSGLLNILSQGNSNVVVQGMAHIIDMLLPYKIQVINCEVIFASLQNMNCLYYF